MTRKKTIMKTKASHSMMIATQTLIKARILMTHFKFKLFRRIVGLNTFLFIV